MWKILFEVFHIKTCLDKNDFIRRFDMYRVFREKYWWHTTTTNSLGTRTIRYQFLRLLFSKIAQVLRLRCKIKIYTMYKIFPRTEYPYYSKYLFPKI